MHVVATKSRKSNQIEQRPAELGFLSFSLLNRIPLFIIEISLCFWILCWLILSVLTQYKNCYRRITFNDKLPSLCDIFLCTIFKILRITYHLSWTISCLFLISNTRTSSTSESTVLFLLPAQDIHNRDCFLWTACIFLFCSQFMELTSELH